MNFLRPGQKAGYIMTGTWSEKANSNIPTMLQYGIHAKNNSLYHTPPTFGIYMLGEVLGWIQ